MEKTIQELIVEGAELLLKNQYDDSISSLNKAWYLLQNNQPYDIQKACYIQHWLGQCYLEKAQKTGDKIQAQSWFDEAIQHHEEELELASLLTDEQKKIEKQGIAQHWLGQCYLGKARKTGDETQAQDWFDKAIKHHEEQLTLANQLTDEQQKIEEQQNAQFWLGRCYLEKALEIGDKVQAQSWCDKAIQHHEEQLKLVSQLMDEQKKIEKQQNVQFWLGRCYLEKALKTGDEIQTQSWFDDAIKHHEKQLKLANQLTDEQQKIEAQQNAQAALGRCYFKQALKTGDEVLAQDWFDDAIKHHEEQLKLANQLTDEQQKIEAQQNAQSWLKQCYFEKAKKIQTTGECSAEILRKYFDLKKSFISEKLKLDVDKECSKIEKYIVTILTSLHITPYELGKIPLAHYTNPTVCNLLFNLAHSSNSKQNIPSKMRMGSATYMNDPLEGKSLLELLNLQDLDLQNKTDFDTYNAFFSCFSTRINDLNQFRLYGKEDGVEASGCCLVFNKEGNWLKIPNIEMAYPSLSNNALESNEYLNNQYSKTNSIKNDKTALPLYQVAYIAYLDEYINKDKCDFELENNQQNFGIYLQCIGSNDTWHKIRLEKLKEGLNSLIKYIRKNKYLSIEEKKSLEYIRYLFKDFAFRDEEEFRLLTITKLGDSELEYCSNTNSVYMPYAEICNMVNEVILGVNFEKTNSKNKVEVFRYQMKKRWPKVKVSHSSLPINANPPYKPD
ncbi:sel1 repeat family protein [Neisseria sp. S1]|uniref:sel1 repeat family protein n=1 Tax=Neisseria sp. S1 TaxID=3318354 RepID=UPI003A88EA2F